ncbi:PREDICTED: uncharacterized protein LOC105970545 [Erythranthe guttata]|uniref:uncharacterized protein LOC105970545 n=1 Tax=Erythranthe guttata TaxID=4155 RepID=UPI00064DA63B|nr:PREDICTED: uncharacterized protein LOC105970545 [Erythranthe guttata]|eukprot:XP_012850834.1 PREDICTED: uncharacterized protein LOC105970545 [Erythranthe guttata]
MGSKIIAEAIVENMQAKPLMCANDVIIKAKKDYGITINYHVAWRTIEASTSCIFGDEALSFSFLTLYFREAGHCNPDSVFDVEVDDADNSFKRCFFSFGASLSGFNLCHQMLILDGTFLKGKYKGVLLSAIAKDARNSEFYIFSFSFSDSLFYYSVLTFVSDRQRGILEAVKDIFPHCHHYFCILHLENNLKNRLSGMPPNYRDMLERQFTACACAPTKQIFHQNLEKLKSSGLKKVIDFLSELPFDNWTYAYSETRRYGELYLNAVESWNSAMKKFRHLPITELVDSIRGWVTDKVCERITESKVFKTMLCPEMEKVLNNIVDAGRTCNVRRSTGIVIQVHSDMHVIVDLFNRTCTCRMWQITGFPCCHVAVVLFNTPETERYTYIDPLFYASYFRSTYSFLIHPLLVDFEQVEQPIVRPPSCQTRKGQTEKEENTILW